MVIPDTFGRRGVRQIASYDYYDIAEGTGVKVFYGCGTTDSVGVAHLLTGSSLYSHPIYTVSDAMNQTAFTLEKTINFDLQSFNVGKTMKSTSFIDGSFRMYAGAGANSGQGYVVFTFQHFDGDSTYTDFGAVTTGTLTVSSDSNTFLSFCLDCALTETQFKRGESLRIRAQIYGKRTDTGVTVSGSLAHDPKNRDSSPFTAATNHTSLNFQIPFKLNL